MLGGGMVPRYGKIGTGVNAALRAAVAAWDRAVGGLVLFSGEAD